MCLYLQLLELPDAGEDEAIESVNTVVLTCSGDLVSEGHWEKETEGQVEEEEDQGVPLSNTKCEVKINTASLNHTKIQLQGSYSP